MPDGESFVELRETDSAGALRAHQFIKDTYGTDHPLTKDAHRELVRIQALEETMVQDIPIHISMARLAGVLSSLEAKLGQQADLMQQAKDQYEKAEKRITDIAATTDDIEAEIRLKEKERDRLIAKSIPTGKDIDAQDLSLTLLTKFLDGAMDVEDSATIIRLQEELAAIDRKVRQSQAGSGSTITTDFAKPAGPEAPPPPPNPGPLLGPPQFRDPTHQELFNAHQATQQALVQAKEKHVASLLALTQALGSAADIDPDTGASPPPTQLHEANIKVSSAQAEEQQAHKANEASKEALHQYVLHLDKDSEGMRRSTT
jgi:hypothetical protein